MRLFDWLKRGIQGFIDGVKNKPKEPEITNTISENMKYNEEREKFYRRKEKYRELMELANQKYDAITDLNLGSYSLAYQNAGGRFSVEGIEDNDALFREIARAQTFIQEPTSNIEVVKKYTEDLGIDLYVGRGNGDQNLKDFWKAVNYAKEDGQVKTDLALKRYSGAFEYAFKVWQQGDKYMNSEDIKDAIQDFLDKEKEVHAKNINTPNELKYEMPDDELEDEKFDF